MHMLERGTNAMRSPLIHLGSSLNSIINLSSTPKQHSIWTKAWTKLLLPVAEAIADLREVEAEEETLVDPPRLPEGLLTRSVIVVVSYAELQLNRPSRNYRGLLLDRLTTPGPTICTAVETMVLRAGFCKVPAPMRPTTLDWWLLMCTMKSLSMTSR